MTKPKKFFASVPPDKATHLAARAIFAASLVFAITTDLARAQTCSNAPPGLVSWWSAEGDATDRIGGNNGNINGNLSFTQGEVGQAFAFDGSSSYIDLGSPGNLQLQNLTIEAWIKRFSSTASSLVTPNASILSYGVGGYGFGLWYDGRLLFTHADVDDVEVNVGLTDTNNFHHVAVTKSGGTVTVLSWMGWHLRPRTTIQFLASALQ